MNGKQNKEWLANEKTMIFAAVLLVVMVAPLWAQKESDFKTDGKGIITGYTGWDSDIKIPEKINGVPITGIGEKAFLRMGLTSVRLPPSIRYIGKWAFAENKIYSILIPSGCYIAAVAFEDNNRLERLFLGDNVIFEPDSFNYFVYYEYLCNGRKAGYFDTTVKYNTKREGDYGFIETKYGAVIIRYYGNEVNRLQIPRQLGGAAVKGIGIYNRNLFNTYIGAFADKNISRMQLPDGLIFISDGGFVGNSNLKSVTIPKSVISIGGWSFNTVENVTFESGGVTLYKDAFLGDLPEKYCAGGAGTYTQINRDSSNSDRWPWAKQ